MWVYMAKMFSAMFEVSIQKNLREINGQYFSAVLHAYCDYLVYKTFLLVW